jgi:hypothetical protein
VFIGVLIFVEGAVFVIIGIWIIIHGCHAPEGFDRERFLPNSRRSFLPPTKGQCIAFLTIAVIIGVTFFIGDTKGVWE